MSNVFAVALAGLGDLYDLGGPVVLLLLLLSVISAAVVIYKLWQFSSARVGRHERLQEGLRALDAGDNSGATRQMQQSRSHLAPIMVTAMEEPMTEALAERLEAEAEDNLSRLERGFPILDSIAQIAPLLGLFGTVLGMIDAFRALQAAGAAVDPSILAGGIWVALLTTAVGLAVAMPTSILMTILESRMTRERGFAELSLARVRSPRSQGSYQLKSA